MDIYSMNLEQVNKRMSELDSIVERSEDLKEIDNCTKEKKELNKRHAVLSDLKERKEIARGMQDGSITDYTIIETMGNITENRTMDNENIELKSFQKYVASGGKIESLTEQEQRSLNIGNSGAVLPTSIMNKLITSEDYSDLLQRATVMTEENVGKIYIPIASNTSANWKIENSEVDGSSNTYEASPTITKLELGGFELYRWMQASAATMSRSTADFTDMMLNLLASEVVEALEYAFINGAGTTQPKGLANLTYVTDTNQILTSGAAVDIAAGDIAEALSLLPQKYARGAVVLCNADMLYKIGKFLGTSEYAFNLADGATKFLGKQIVVSEHVADDNIYIVDPNELYVRFSMPLTLEVDKSSGFTAASYNLRALTVVDAAWNPAACVHVGLGTT